FRNAVPGRYSSTETRQFAKTREWREGSSLDSTVIYAILSLLQTGQSANKQPAEACRAILACFAAYDAARRQALLSRRLRRRLGARARNERPARAVADPTAANRRSATIGRKQPLHDSSRPG